jgi:predicted unusual protein kinase regulating ubiquinone biosynthesis (AarF/ABC1/UbiB family)
MEFVKGINVDKGDSLKEAGMNVKEVSDLLSHCFARQMFEFGVRAR